MRRRRETGRKKRRKRIERAAEAMLRFVASYPS
jgi:hypothetical protein